ncbi:MAG: T9SS type A sorting domain-containing protein [Chitinophagales bacterium]
MRNTYLLLLLVFFSVNSFSQSLTPSTYNQVYNFTIGDTLEYEFHIQLDDSYHSYSNGYALFNVTGISQDTDSITYQVHLDVTYTSVSNPLYYPHYGTFPLFAYALNLKDSSIFYGLPGLDSMCNTSYDSVFINQDYNSNKQNELVRMCFESNWSQKYADSLGQVSSSSFYTTGSPWWEGQSQSLIYYHKVNGSKWGTPNYFIVAGVNDLERKLYTQLYPNPATISFTLQLSTAPNTPTYFQLYDAMGRQVRQEEITATSTTLNRNNLPKGIYFWQLLTRQNVLQRGKLVME